MKIVQVVPSISVEADGVGYYVRHLNHELVKCNLSSRIAALYWSPLAYDYNHADLFKISVPPKSLGVSFSLRKYLTRKIVENRFSIIHSHGLWMMPNIYVGSASKISNAKLLISPHGSLAARSMSQSRFKKFIFWQFFQYKVLKDSFAFHATSEDEYLSIRRMGFKQPVFIIPAGVNIPSGNKPIEYAKRRKLLFLARVNPIKGIDFLLRAWGHLHIQFPSWDLHVAGPDNSGYLAEMKILSRNLGLQRVFFEGPLYGEEKEKAFQSASVYVLPSHTENFGITVAESLAAGTPVITTKGTPWSLLPIKDAGWWINNDEHELVACLREVLSNTPEQLSLMGANGQRWMMEEFSWPSIAQQFVNAYEWIQGDGPPTDELMLD